jgi:hypothetical protein
MQKERVFVTRRRPGRRPDSRIQPFQKNIIIILLWLVVVATETKTTTDGVEI